MPIYIQKLYLDFLHTTHNQFDSQVYTKVILYQCKYSNTNLLSALDFSYFCNDEFAILNFDLAGNWINKLIKMKIAVVGCGHWGKNLVRNFSELGYIFRDICTYIHELHLMTVAYN